jgi:hypothetical protein
VVNFAAGETFKTVNVPVLSDAIPEPDETVNLTLTAPTGGTLGTQATSVLTIKDVASAPPTPLPPGSSVVGNTLQFNDLNNAATIDASLLSLFPGGVNGGAGDDQFTIPATTPSTPATIRGEAGNDVVNGVAANAPLTVDGGDGNDLITGSTVTGDKLLGGAGDDIITAGAAGGAMIVGGPGLDRLIGSGGAANTFAFQGSDATTSFLTADQITGFAAGTDKIGLGPDIASLVISIETVNADGGATADDTAFTFVDASGVKKYLAVALNATVTPAQLATTLTNVAPSTFTI